MSDDKPSNVIPLGRKPETLAYVEPADPVEVLSYVHSASKGHLCLAIVSPPDDVPAWVLSSPDAVEALGIHIIQFAARMRGRGGPP